MAFLVKQFEICAFPEAQPFIEHLLTTGQAIVLFDGLDEVNQEDEQRAYLSIVVNNFSKQYNDSSCLITCRRAATEYSFDQFTYVEMADFDNNQIRIFVLKWFHGNPVKQQKFLKEFEKDEHKGLRELAQTPLLLTLLCLAFEETMRFPQRRVELYEEAIDTLFKKWDSLRNIKRDEIYRKLSLGRKRQMLARIAAETFEQAEYFFHQADLAKRITRYLQKLPPADVDEDIDGEAVLKAIEAQHGLLVERAHRIYSFSHLTFQEYFTAKYVVDNTSQGTLELLISHHLTDDRWREVFLLTAGLLDNADIFFVLSKHAIDYLIQDDEKLVEFVRWANYKAATDYTGLSYNGRSFALALALARVHTRHRERPFTHSADSVDLVSSVHIRPSRRERTFTRDLALALALALDRNLALDQDRALIHDLAFNLDLALDHALDLPHIRDLELDLGRAIYLAKELHLPDLHQDLVRLVIPSERAIPEMWRTFAANLQDIMVRYRNIGHSWSLTTVQVKQISQYYRANQLLLDCLKLAYVSDRARIENQLWTPPEEKRQA